MKMRLSDVGLALCIAFGFSAVASARIINIPEDQQTIQAGIDAAEAGDTVLVQPGEYRERLRIVRSVILGSLTLTTENPAYLDSTIINGQQQGTVIEATSADQNSVLLIRGFTIKNGQRPGYSGGIYIPRFGSVLLQDLLVTANAGTVPGEHPCGGGIEMGGRRQPNVGANSTVTMERVRVIGNRSEYAGGGVAIFFVGLTTLRDCIITDNDGGGYSGGIYPICNLIMSHVLIANNVAGNSGGAFHVFPGGGEERRFELDHVTIVGNRAGEYGAFEGGFDAGSSLTNSIVWGNVSTNGGPLEAVAAQINISFCDLEGGEDGIVGPRPNFEAILDSDPLFADPDNGDYHLTENSPCIDAGDPEAPGDPDGTRADMGAFYFHQRDIEVEPTVVRFVPIGFGEIDSLPIAIRNVGENDLIIETIVTELDWACFSHQFVDLPLTIAPESTFILWAIFQPVPRRVLQSIWQIESNDPDEPMIFIGLSGESLSVPREILHSSLFTLHSAFPNPFNSSTTIRFSLSSASTSASASLRIYGLDGRLMDRMDLGRFEAGEHSVVWNAGGLPAGVYLIRLESGNEISTIKAVLMK